MGESKADTGKGYTTKQEATEALDAFLDESGLPPPVIIDSGTGIHAYLLFVEDVESDVYLHYAEKFKEYCLELIYAYPAVMD